MLACIKWKSHKTRQPQPLYSASHHFPAPTSAEASHSHSRSTSQPTSSSVRFQLLKGESNRYNFKNDLKIFSNRVFWAPEELTFNLNRITLFIFGCTGSSFYCWVWALTHCSAWASHCSGICCCRARALLLAQELWCTGLVAPRHVRPSWAKDWTRVLCIGRNILNHWTTREVRPTDFLKGRWGGLFEVLSEVCLVCIPAPLLWSLRPEAKLCHCRQPGLAGLLQFLCYWVALPPPPKEKLFFSSYAHTSPGVGILVWWAEVILIPLSHLLLTSQPCTSWWKGPMGQAAS